MAYSFRVSAVFLAMAALPGCAEFTHLTRTRSAAGMRLDATYIDAKQRAVMTELHKEQVVQADGSVAMQKSYSFCAEPSPDALSAIAASQGFSLTRENIELQMNNSLAETAASIGLRTQSIQLMRDAMYRLCEARMSGYIDDLAFETMHRRFQSSMVAILAIEQLTGAVRAPTVVLSSEAKSGAADLVAEYTDKALNQKNKWDSATATHATELAKLEDNKKNELAEKEKAIQPGSEQAAAISPAEQGKIDQASKLVKEQEPKVAQAEKNKNDAKAAYEAMEAARIAALSGGGSAKASAEFEHVQRATLSDAAAGAVSGAVKDIVAQTLELSFSRELCTTILVAAARDQLGPQSYARASATGLQGVGAKLDALREIEEQRAKAADELQLLNAELASVDEALADTNANKRRAAQRRKGEINTQLDATGQNLANQDARARELALELADGDGHSKRGLAIRTASDVATECGEYLRQSVESFADSAAASVEMTKANTALVDAITGMIKAKPGDFANEATLNALRQLLAGINPQNRPGDLGSLALTPPP